MGEEVKKDFEPGDIIEYNGEQYKVLENNGEFGAVKDSAGETVLTFYWDFEGHESVLVGKASRMEAFYTEFSEKVKKDYAELFSEMNTQNEQLLGLIASKEIGVVCCCTDADNKFCTFLNTGDFNLSIPNTCNAKEDREIEDTTELPEWCPLKSGPVIVRLRG